MPQYARSLRARRDIKEALVELLRSKQLDQIGMSELARTAHAMPNNNGESSTTASAPIVTSMTRLASPV
jgi:hypothetical protein